MTAPTTKHATAPIGLFPLVDAQASERKHYRAKATGEFRAPLAGEWYLSGAIVEAYRAHSDLTTPYYVARIVPTRTETVTSEVQS